MYQYDPDDFQVAQQRADQFRDQVARRIDGRISEDEFKPLRLQNGLYMQLHSYMLRVAIPYGLLSSKQLHTLASIADDFDRGYGHFTTRQNIQYNWTDLRDVPLILDRLASVGMHAIQTSGNCIRNVTSDPFAGSAADESVDPRIYCELLRQWSTFHPEFAFLPRKFKIAVTGADEDRAAIAFHDIGLKAYTDNEGQIRFEVWVGGGQGRTPVIAKVIEDALPEADLLAYLESILRVYNRFGRRDNKYKARIKILVNALGESEFRDTVRAEFEAGQDTRLRLEPAMLEEMRGRFTRPTYEERDDLDLDAQGLLDPEFGHWVNINTRPHREPGYRIVVVTLKESGLPPGDANSDQMRRLATLAAEYSQDRIVVTHRQNLVLPDVEQRHLRSLWRELKTLGLGVANADRASDTIACPGLDYCNLANARSIDIAQWIEARVGVLDAEHNLGPISLNISGCINACGHHHVGHIGILGINKLGEEFYQISVGGNSTTDASIGRLLGRAFSRDAIVDAIEMVLRVYLAERVSENERFIQCVRRIGVDPFKEALYGDHQGPKATSGRVDVSGREQRRSA